MMHTFVADFRLFSVLQVSRFDCMEAYLAYHRIREMEWVDKAFIGWYSYVGQSGEVLDIPALEVATAKRTSIDLHVVKLVYAVSVVFKTGHRNTMAGEADAVGSVLDSSADFTDPSAYVHIVEEEKPWDLVDFTPRDDRGPSPLQRVQQLCRTRRTHGQSLLSDVLSVKLLIKGTLETLASADGDATSFAHLKETYAADQTTFEKFPTTFENMLEDANRCIQEFEHIGDTLDELVIKVDVAEKMQKGSRKHFSFHEDTVSKQSNQLLEKDAASIGYREDIVVVEQKLEISSADVVQLTTQETVERDLLDGVCTAFAPQKSFTAACLDVLQGS